MDHKHHWGNNLKELVCTVVDKRGWWRGLVCNLAPSCILNEALEAEEIGPGHPRGTSIKLDYYLKKVPTELPSFPLGGLCMFVAILLSVFIKG